MKRETLHGDYHHIIGESAQIFKVLEQIDDFAPTDLSVLILGATGTGKELVARAVHENSGRSGELVSVNCGAIQENLAESELFGHEQGAFTDASRQHIGRFERAHKGTLFLDEIAEMPPLMQTKLLRALEDHEIERVGGEEAIRVDVRCVAATNRDIAAAIREKRLRDDLYHRLMGVEISVPSLAERRSDIKLLVDHFLGEYCDPLGVPVPQMSLEALSVLEGYPWPGNVRELKSMISRAAVASHGATISPTHLPEKIQEWPESDAVIAEESAVREDAHIGPFPINTPLKAIEAAAIRDTLAAFGGNQTKTAESLQIGISTLRRKRKEYGI